MWQRPKKKRISAKKGRTNITFWKLIRINKSIVSASSLLSWQPKPTACNTTGSLDKLTWTTYVVVKTQSLKGRWQRRLPNGTKSNNGERTDFIQFMRLKIQLVGSAENFRREENLSTVQTLTLSKVLNERLKLAHKTVDFEDWARWTLYVTLLRINLGEPESWYAWVRLPARKKKNETFQKKFSVKCKLEENIYLLDEMISVLDKFNTNKSNGFVRRILSATEIFGSFFQISSGWVRTLDVIEIFFSSQSQIGFLFCCPYNPKNLSLKTNCYWNSTITKHWKNWSQRTIFLPEMDNM